MSSKKKESEAFKMLQFMYQDDDDDMEDAEKDDDDEEFQPQELQQNQAGEGDSSQNDVVMSNSAASTPKLSNLRPPTPQQSLLSTVTQQGEWSGSDAQLMVREKPTIVDYGHDDMAMSPDPEEGEITGRVLYGERLQNTNADFDERTPSGRVQSMTPSNQVTSPQVDASQSDMADSTVKESETEAMEGANNIFEEVGKDVDPLDVFLPPPPKLKCSDELQERINKFLAYKRQGKSFNAEVRNRKDYRNPDFLLHAVRYQDIDQIGSCFSKDVFDPHGYDESDFVEAIEADMKREMERKEQERKKNQKVDFVSGGTQPGAIAAAQKLAVRVPGASNFPSGGLPAVPTSANAVAREGRQNKKSKWDKIDGDGRNPLGGGQDTISSVGAHAAILSAANAGAGYAVFAQQKRREAEERRSSSDKKVDRRSS